MQKKSILFLIIVTISFISISIANAQVNLNPLEKKSYNKGDLITISGSISSDQTQTLPLKIFLNCDTNQIQVHTKNYDLQEGQEVSFTQEITVPISMSGQCIVIATLGQEKAESDPFVITKSLKGTFTLTPIQVQSGGSFEFFGTVTKLNGEKVDGYATIYLEKDGENFLTTNQVIQNGKIDFKEKISDVPEGSYHINVEIKDIFGNEEFFYNTKILNVYTTLKITATTDKTSYNPKETIKLTGDIKATVGATLDEGTVIIGFDSNDYDTQIIGGKFRFDIPVSSTISSGTNQIDITVKDNQGNIGQKSIKVSIIPKEIRLEASLDKDTYLPKEIMSITPNLYDQAQDLINKKINVVIFDARNGKVLDRSLQTVQAYQFKLDPYAIPGTWKITLKSSILEHELTFVIEEVEEVNIALDGQSIVVTNIGNVKYNNNILIEAINDKGESNTISLRTKIDPSQELFFPLYKELPAGNYDEIRIKDRDQTFFNVDVRDDRTFAQKAGDFMSQATGSVVGASGTTSNNGPILYSLIAIILLLLVIVFIRLKARRKKERFRQREIKAGQQAKKYLQETVAPQKKTYGKATESDVKDFKSRMLSDIKDQQKDHARQEDWGTSSPGRPGSGVRQSIERKIIFDKDNAPRSQSYSFDRPKERRYSFTTDKNKQEQDKDSSQNHAFDMFK